MSDKKQEQETSLKPIFVRLSEATPQPVRKQMPPQEESARLFSAIQQTPSKPIVWKRLVAKENEPLAETPTPKTPGL